MMKTIILSHRYFSGFEVILDLDNFDSVKDVIEFVISKLESYLCILNLGILLREARCQKWHFHNVDYISDLKIIQENTLYLCAHEKTML